ncbi:DUF2088 domain-containing protein [Christensenellaceae bacterium NSJ-53]|uniref:DUF2088 domain-containing protein n=2 Tax=Gehongia tenuis TaxID=2763655 RepID=A0A926D579_9FIRM|nr:lactate racemase domain-containing protein [Gehongia tenuis]MBC8531567.1 DUF2088 domain-containing protein [Gehongia tenuis]
MEREAGAIQLQELERVFEKKLYPKLKGMRRILLIPPDITRLHSGAGRIAAMIYSRLKDEMTVDFIIALGTHLEMTRAELRQLFGMDIPLERIHFHRWRVDVAKIGEVPAAYVAELSGGRMNETIPVEVNRAVINGDYDFILSLGQVVPHEVVGMANYSKNIFVGLGGRAMIDATHYLGAVCGIENILGRIDTPVRKVLDYAGEHFLKDMPLYYAMTVVGEAEGKPAVKGFYLDNRRSAFEAAARLSQRINFEFVDRPMKKVVAYMDPGEFRTTWVGNKAIYRTRMMMADGGELIVLAPGIEAFGEDREVDDLLTRYGYRDTEGALALVAAGPLAQNRGVAAHMMHSSPDGRFRVTYGLDRMSRDKAVKGRIRFEDYGMLAKKYDPGRLKPGINWVDGEEVYFIPNPALGLWALRDRLEN